MSTFFLLSQLFKPTVASAAGSTAHLGGIIQGVGTNLTLIFTGAGYGGGIQGISGAVVGSVWIVLLPIGIFLVVRAGFSLIISQDEGKLSTAKRTIASTLVGIILTYISQRLVTGLYVEGILNDTGASTLQDVVYGIANWSLVTVAALGVLMIVISIIRAISGFGKEEGVSNIRHTINGVVTGILMISLLPAIKITLGIVDLQPLGDATRPNPGQIIITVTTIIAQLLTYLTLLAVAVVIYAGVRMIVNLGNEDEYKKARTLIGRTLIGLVVILLSYAIVALILSIATGGTTGTVS